MARRKPIAWVIWLPIFLWLMMAGWILSAGIWVDRQAYPLEEVLWVSPAGEARVRHVIEQNGHTQWHRLRVVATATDHALWVGSFPLARGDVGLVRAVQADHDPELEIVAWNQTPASFILDWDHGKVTRKPMGEAIPMLREWLARWGWYHGQGRLYLTLGLFLLPTWYGALGISTWARRMRKT